MLKQLSIFAENIKGKMQRVTGILLEEDIKIMVLHVPDISEVEACLRNKGFNSISEVH